MLYFFFFFSIRRQLLDVKKFPIYMKTGECVRSWPLAKSRELKRHIVGLDRSIASLGNDITKPCVCTFLHDFKYNFHVQTLTIVLDSDICITCKVLCYYRLGLREMVIQLSKDSRYKFVYFKYFFILVYYIL